MRKFVREFIKDHGLSGMVAHGFPLLLGIFVIGKGIYVYSVNEDACSGKVLVLAGLSICLSGLMFLSGYIDGAYVNSLLHITEEQEKTMIAQRQVIKDIKEEAERLQSVIDSMSDKLNRKG